MAESLKQQQQRVKLEQEYQAALNTSASLNTKIAKDLQKQVDAAGDLSDEMKSFVTGINSSVSGLSDTASITKEILKLENQQKTLTASITSENRALVLEKKDALDTAIEALRVEEKILQATENVDKQAQQYVNTIGGALDKMASHVSQIPILGGLLGGMATKAANSIKENLGNAAKQFVVDFKAGMTAGKSQAAGLANAVKKSGGGIFKAMFSWKIALLGILGLFALAVMAMDKAEKAMISFRQETGMIKGQFAGAEQKAMAAASATYGMTGSLEEGAKLAGQMYNAFGGIEDISQGVLTNTVKLAAGLGMSVEAIGGVNKLFQNAFGASQELAQSMVNTTINASTLAGVPADKVLKDMAESSADMYAFFKGSPQQLQKSAIQAAKLGTSLKQSAEVSKSLLNFEDSINSELEASALLGRNLNFNQARYLAATGDTVGAQQAVLKEVGKIGDISKLNYYQQEALAKAAGMPIADMINQQRIQKNLGKLDGERMKAANALIAKGADASKLTKKQLDAELHRQNVENQRTTTLETLQRLIESIAMELGSILQPEAEGLLTWLQDKDNREKVKAFIDGVKEGFNTIRDTLTAVYEKVKPHLDGLLTSLGVIGGPDSEGGSAQSAGKGFAIMAAAIMGLSIAGPILGGLLGLTSTLLGGVFKLGGGILSTTAKIFSKADTATKNTAKSSGNILVKLGQGIRSIGGGIGGFITSIGKGAGSAISSIGKGLGGALRGMSGGLAALANPAALIGLAALVLAIEGIAVAIRIAGPGLEPFGNMMKSIFEGIASIVVPIIDILVNGFVKLADVIGGVILGIMQEFGNIVGIVADAFVSIAEVVGSTIIGIFETVSSTLGMIIENSGKAGEVLKMAGAITAVAVAMAAFGGGAAIGAAAGMVGALFEAGTSLIGGKTPDEKLDELLTKGPALASFASALTPALETFSALTASATGILGLAGAFGLLAKNLELVAASTKKLEPAKINEIAGTAGQVNGKGKGKLSLPASVEALAVAVNNLATVDNKNMIDKLEEIRKAVIVGALIEMDGEILTRSLAAKQEAFNEVNFASRLKS
jgi:hypothetical protein